MATELNNLSIVSTVNLLKPSRLKIGVVYANWNKEITYALKDGAVAQLLENKIEKHNILEIEVPGAFELALGAQYLLEYAQADAVICLGCVIQGDTKHFDFICNGATQGIMDLNLKFNRPVVFGVLTTNTHQQALDRCGGVCGNKGIEAAQTALFMISCKEQILNR
ncbi:MAG: 6,7-dimethyl-8-ribityllumazine synthase [Bacteroidia bacterium]